MAGEGGVVAGTGSAVGILATTWRTPTSQHDVQQMMSVWARAAADLKAQQDVASLIDEERKRLEALKFFLRLPVWDLDPPEEGGASDTDESDDAANGDD